MVRILSNGEIVADNDDRLTASGAANSQRGPPPARQNIARLPAGDDANAGEQQQRRRHRLGAPVGEGGDAGGGQAANEPGPNFGRTNPVSIYDAINNRLVGFGIPTWSVGGTAIEPAVSVGLLIALLLFGLPGIIMVAFMFILYQLGQTGSLRGVYESLIGNRRPTNANRNNRRNNIVPNNVNNANNANNNASNNNNNSNTSGNRRLYPQLPTGANDGPSSSQSGTDKQNFKAFKCGGQKLGS